MKIRFLFLLGWFVSLAAVAQQSEVRSIGSFTGVKSGEAIDVYLKKGDKESVKVEVTGEELGNVVTEIAGTYLRIHIRDNRWFHVGKTDIKVYVTYVKLEKIVASSASNVFSDGVITANNMEIHVSSAADVELSLEATDVEVRASSAGEITLEGKARSIDAEASSSGEVDAYNFQVERARGSASSGGDIKLNVTSELTGNASSGGGIRYRGNPSRTNTHASSGGSVKKSN